MDGWMDGFIYVCMYGWMDGRMDGWMDGWMYLCMYTCTYVCMHALTYSRFIIYRDICFNSFLGGSNRNYIYICMLCQLKLIFDDFRKYSLMILTDSCL